MATYRNPVEMIRDIRAHVVGVRHRVQPADDSMRQMLGYKCPTCEEYWEVGLLAMKRLELPGLMGFPLGVFHWHDVRDKLTAYLNCDLEDKPRARVVPVLSRYKRSWVI